MGVSGRKVDDLEGFCLRRRHEEFSNRKGTVNIGSLHQLAAQPNLVCNEAGLAALDH